MAGKKKWIQKAISRPGRVKNAAKRAGISTHQMAVRMSHSSDASARGAGNLALRFQKGKLHAGGEVPETGLYEMEKGEKVIPAPQKAYQHEVVEAMPNSPSAEGCGHWEIDGTSVKFVKG
jgi:hypothetical protein